MCVCVYKYNTCPISFLIILVLKIKLSNEYESAFLFGYTTGFVGSQFPDQGLNPCPLQLKCRVLPTGLPGKSLKVLFNYKLKIKLTLLVRDRDGNISGSQKEENRKMCIKGRSIIMRTWVFGCIYAVGYLR